MNSPTLANDIGTGGSYAHDGFAVLRTPLLPFDTFMNWCGLASSCEPQSGSPLADENTFLSERVKLAEFIKHSFQGAELREALFVASPDLHRALAKSETLKDGVLADRALLALVRYFTRATCRPTPFGLFAGCTLVEIGSHTHLEFGASSTYSRHTRFDMDYLAELARELSGSSEVRRSTSLASNTSAYLVAGRWHYVATQYVAHGRQYTLDAVDASAAITDTLARALTGATLDSLASALVDGDVLIEDARGFIHDLIDAQLLVPVIDPILIGADATQVLLSDVSHVRERREYAEVLSDARDKLIAMDARGVGVPASAYAACEMRLEALPIRTSPGRLFQVDLFKPTTGATLGEGVVAEASRAADILCRLVYASDRLVDFVRRFELRYDHREVPMLEALDDEVGIGLESSAEPNESLTAESSAARQREVWLAELRVRAAAEGTPSLELTHSDFARLQQNHNRGFPDSLSIQATLLARSARAADAGEFQLLVNGCFGPSGGTNIARFGHLDATLNERLRAHLSAEERLRPEAIFAEVVHLPQGRAGNVISRPSLRTFEIPYLGRSTALKENQIGASDLSLTVNNGRLILRSRRLGREVIPRLTSAHNFAAAEQLPVYRFLCLMQYHGLVGGAFAWDWGSHESVAPFLPRITAGRLILSRARWLITESESHDLSALTGVARFDAARRWRERRTIPRFAVIAEGDNRLPIDFDNSLSVDVFVELTRHRRVTIIQELLPEAEDLCASGPEGRFTHELVIPLTKVARSRPRVEPPERGANVPGRRSFIPGSQWMYVKLYCGAGMGDRILQTVVAPLARSVIRENLVSHWFFLRYRDPHFHIRLRLHGDADVLHSLVMSRLAALSEPLLDNAALSKLQYDTYEREVERYGGFDAVACAERLFWVDSESTLEILDLISDDQTTDSDKRRLYSVIQAIDGLFDAFEMPLERRRPILEGMTNGPASVRRVWGEWYRRNRRDLEQLLSRKDSHGHTAIHTAFTSRLQRMMPIARELRRLEVDKRLTSGLDDIFRSYCHMSANRLLRPVNARAESMCYDALRRFYQSQVARSLSAT
jgi:thiopeptide-type bacteriocin biosynthesis protein